MATTPSPSAPPNAAPQPPPRGRRRLGLTAAALVLGAAMFTTGALVLDPDGPAPTATREDQAGPQAHGTAQARIERLRDQLRRTPENPPAWAQLGLEYVQQAKNTADPSYYRKADKALHKSLTQQPDGNFTAEAGMGALAAARHKFTDALHWAQRAVRTNPYNAAARGVLGDAFTQLGRYPEAFETIQKMVDLEPATPSLARASYTWELRGDVERAEDLMRRALDAASDPADAAFARYHLALLALGQGDAAGALDQAQAGLRAAPGTPSLLEARARAHAALGHTDAAVRDYRAAIARVPQPTYVIALGELQQSLGHGDEAREQYALYRSQERLFSDAGVVQDAEAALFEADHGDPREAVELGRQAVRTRPFLASQDAYAWALHKAGRDEDALAWSDESLQLGTRSALYHFHRGMIEHALGDEEAAEADLRVALETDPHFHPLHAPTARHTLRQIGGDA